MHSKASQQPPQHQPPTAAKQTNPPRLAALLLAVLITASSTANARSAAQVNRFRQLAPCPVTGLSKGTCPGWQVDHITPLCAGGADHPSNLQWITLADHRFKTFIDVRECRKRRRHTRTT